MKLAALINSGILLAAITLIPGIAAAQTVTSSNINQAVNSKVYLQPSTQPTFWLRHPTKVGI